jgi:hypothetical protein
MDYDLWVKLPNLAADSKNNIAPGGGEEELWQKTIR